MVMAGVPVMMVPLTANNCSDDNARFDITILPSDWVGGAAGALYMGTLLITVEAA